MPSVKDVIVRKPTPEEAKKCESWPIWECDPSTFEWDYTQTETCLLIEGEVIVRDAESEVSFQAGDMVVFPVDLHCTWEIKKKVRKYYDFS